MTTFKFTKMHGLGNDFVVIETLTQSISLSAKLIQKIADRHYGIGCDQVLIISPASTPTADFDYRIFNSDGSTAGQCGNGARCVARFVRDKGFTYKKNLVFALANSSINADVSNNDHIRVNMGAPNFNPHAIPLQLAPSDLYSLKLDHTDITFAAVSMGNPHCIIPVDAPLESFPLDQWGMALNHHPAFPQGVNVSLMQVDSRQHLTLRVFERGAGETLACGSAACAAMVCAYRLNLVDTTVAVRLPGGQLTISWAGENQPVWMSGPATHVYDGIWADESKFTHE